METIIPEFEGVEEYAAEFSVIANEGVKSRKLAKMIEGFDNSPVLLIDFHHNIPGEVVSLSGLDDVLKKDAGVYKIMLFDSDDLGTNITEISKKLSDNLAILGSWTVIFTNAGKYCDLEAFRDFMESSDSVGRVVLV